MGLDSGRMSVFIGGSAYNMVRDVADGFVIVTERTFRNFGAKELSDFSLEANRYLQDIRSNQPALTETEAIQKRQRRMRRLQQAVALANNALQRR
jgi:hypothetical protein